MAPTRQVSVLISVPDVEWGQGCHVACKITRAFAVMFVHGEMAVSASSHPASLTYVTHVVHHVLCDNVRPLEVVLWNTQ